MSALIRCCLVAAFLLSTAIARTDTGTEARRPIVELMFVGPLEDVRAVEDSLRELLHRASLELRATIVDRFEIADVTATPDVAVRGWIDLRSSSTAIVILSDPRSNRPTSPRLISRVGSRTVQLEEVAFVVQAGVESMVANTDPPSPVPAATPVQRAAPVDAPAASPTERRALVRSWDLDLATFASGGPYASGFGVLFGVGAEVELVPRGAAWIPVSSLMGEYHPPFGNSSLPLELRAAAWSARIAFDWRVIDDRRWILSIGAGAGPDVIVLSSGAAAPNIQVNANRTDASLVLTGLATLALAFGTNSRVFVRAVTDWDTQPHRYDVFATRTQNPVIETMRLRPSVAVGFSFDVITGSDR